jgi:sugar lactone lactonase YvrE
VLVALADGLMLLDPDHADQTVRRVTMTLAPGIRLNDGSCDPAGRFWVGSMAEDSRQVLGHLYRWQDGESEVMLGDVTLSNGIDWTSDGTLMYYVDSLRHRVDVFDFDADTGAIRDRRVLAEIPPSEGIPDGLTVDVDGGVWVALFGGGCVRRYDPDGRLDLQVDLPADNVTACSFGGPDYSRLYITTASERVAAHRRRLQPDAGAVFAVHTGHVGSPTRYLREGHLPAALVDG